MYYVHIKDVTMGVAFSDSEIETISAKLKARARECLLRYGVRKTSVKDIVSVAGISTGAFYKFYDSKELLFFEVMEEMDLEVYAAAVKILKERSDLSLREKVIQALISSCRKSDDLGYVEIWEAESAYMLRKLPSEVYQNHITNEGARIVTTLAEFGIRAGLPSGEAADILQWLLTCLAHPMPLYPERRQKASDFMIRAVCEKLFPDESETRREYK
jgi:AcrR family transcriptional regulator